MSFDRSAQGFLKKYLNMITALKRFSTSTQSAQAKSSKWMLYAGAGALVGGAGYYYSNGKTPVKNPSAKVQSYVPAFDGQWKKFKLIEKTTLNHNVSSFRFELPEGTNEVGLPTASCVMVKHKGEGEEKAVIRPYTPILPDVPSNYFDLVVKQYPTGIMSKHIHSLNPNDTLEMKGPNLKFKYEAGKFKQIGMVYPSFDI
jgi:cytochrome-b5 reductase